MVSIIIPAYNAEKFIEKALECAMSQDYDKLEIIVVDDGSTDGTLPAAQAMAAKDRRIKVISQPNGGPGAARNTGLDNATGEYAVFIDADDIVPPDYVKKLRAAVEGYDTAICARTMHYTDGRQVYIPVIDRACSTAEFLRISLTGEISPIVAFTGPVNRIYNLRWLADNSIRFNTAFRYGEDTLFNLRSLMKTNMIGMADTNYSVMETDDSLSKSVSVSRFSVYRHIRSAMDKLIKQYDLESIRTNEIQYFTDNFLARCEEILAVNADRNWKANQLSALLKCGIVNSRDIITARGKKPAWLLLSAVVRSKSGFALLLWFILAPKMGL